MSPSRSKTSPRRAPLASALLAVLALAPSALAQRQPVRPPPRFQRLIQLATEAYQRGDSEGAVRSLEQAYELRPEPLLLYNLARAHELGEHWSEAMGAYDRFLAANPEPAQAAAAREARANAERQLATQRQRAAQNNRQREAMVGTVTEGPPRPVVVQPTYVYGPRRFGVGGGLMVTGAVVGAVGGALGGMALALQSQFDNTQSLSMRASLQDRGTAFAWTANVAIPVGVVTFGVGLILHMLQDTRVPAPAAAPSSPAAARPQARRSWTSDWRWIP